MIKNRRNKSYRLKYEHAMKDLDMDSFDSVVDTLGIIAFILENHSDEEIYQSAIMLRNKANEYLSNEKKELISMANANSIPLDKIGLVDQSDS